MYGESSSTSEESKVGIPSTCRLQYDPPARYAPRAPGRDREARYVVKVGSTRRASVHIWLVNTLTVTRGVKFDCILQRVYKECTASTF